MDARLLLLLLPCTLAVEYDCHSLVPLDAGVMEAPGPPPYRICSDTSSCEVPKQKVFMAEEIISVRLEGVPGMTADAFTSFAMEARLVGGDQEPFGTWRSADAKVWVSGCLSATDYIIHNDLQAKTVVTADWVVPHGVDGEVEFVATVAVGAVMVHRLYWTGISSQRFSIHGSGVNPSIMMSSPLTTHVLDIARGSAAVYVPITVYREDLTGYWEQIAHSFTNSDGRCPGLLTMDQFSNGVYKITFDTASYFDTIGAKTFYPYVDVVFEIVDCSQHYHVPLRLAPFGYCTHKGTYEDSSCGN